MTMNTNFFKLLPVFALAFSMTFFYGCGGGEGDGKTGDGTEQTTGDGHEGDANVGDAHGDANGGDAHEADSHEGDGAEMAYICPMKCEGSESATEGACPVCGMDLVLKSSLEEGGDSHEGHDHDDHGGHEG